MNPDLNASQIKEANLKVFLMFVENRIDINMNFSLTVGIKWNRMRDRNMKVLEKTMKPFNFKRVTAIERYSTSAEDREIVCCLFIFQERGEHQRAIT